MTNSYSDQFGERFQKHILAVMCRHPSFAMRYRTALSDKYFPSPLHAAVVKVLLDQADTYKKIPTEATLFQCASEVVGKDKQDGLVTLFDTIYADDITDADAVMAKTVEFGQTQALCDAVLRSADRMDKGDRAAVKSLIATALQVGEDLLSTGTSFHGTLEKRATGAFDHELAMQMIPTGIHHLDFVMHGGLGRGELGVVVAPPGRGKTSTLINFGYGALLAGYNVVHYTLEMKETRVLKRYDARLAGAYNKVKWDDVSTYAAELARRAAKHIKGDLIVKEYGTRKAGVSSLYAHLSLLVAQGFRPDLTVIDYADIMKPERRLGEFRHEQAGIYEDLRGIASEFNCAVWTASQAGKMSLDKATVTMADFAESFEKAAIVDAAVGLCQTQSEKAKGICRLFGAKFRDTEDGMTIACNIDRARCMIKSTAVYDAGNNRVDAGEYELEVAHQEANKAATATGVTAPAQTTRQLVAAAKAGETGSAPKKEDDGTPQLGTGSTSDLHKSVSRPQRSTGPRRNDRPTTKVAPA